MAENKWVVDGHHYTCPECGNIMAIIENESDEGFDFCPFCGKRMSSHVAENKMEQVAAMFGKKLGEVFSVEFAKGSLGRNRNFASCCYFKADGLFCEDRGPCEIMLNDLLTGKAVIVDDAETSTIPRPAD